MPTPPPPSSPTERIGAPGFAVFGGFLEEFEKDPELQGLRRYKTISDVLANTNIVSAGVRYFLNLIAKARWKVEGPSKKYCDLVEEIIHDMETPWHRVVRRAATYKLYGFSIQEWTAKRRDDGVLGLLDIEPRAQKTIDRWDVDEHGKVLGVVQVAPQDQRDIYLPRRRLVYAVDDSLHNSPEGLGTLRHVIKTARAVERLELLEAWGYETDLRGIPIGRAPLVELEERVRAGTLTSAQAVALRRPMEDFIRGHIKSPTLAMLLDSGTYRATGETQNPSPTKKWDIDLLRGTDGPHAEIAAAIERKNREMARILGVEHLLLGSGQGSHALSSDKSQSFGLTVSGTLMELAEVFQQDILLPIWMLNGFPRKKMPKLKTEQVQFRDLQEITGALKDLAQAGSGLRPDDPAEGEVRDLIGLTRPPLGVAPAQPVKSKESKQEQA